MEKVERLLKLDADAAAILLRLAGSPRKQGAYISALLRREAGRHETSLVGRVAALERELAEIKVLLTQHPGADYNEQ